MVYEFITPLIMLIKPFLYFLFCVSIVVIIFWKKIFNFFGMSEYQAIQKIHSGQIPRVGGALLIATVLLITLIGNELLNEDTHSFFSNLLLPLVCFGYFSIKEDFYHNVSPFRRLISLFIAALLFFLIASPILPIIETPILSSVMNDPLTLTVFFVIAVVTIANGCNMIDGANGLTLIVAIVILNTLIYLSFRLDDFFILNICVILSCMMLTLLLFNYPMGVIFLGDSGAYFVGFVCSILTIIFYGRHPELPYWGAILILIYPLTEVVFSVVRKSYSYKSHPFHPDRRHIHTIFFDYFLGKGFTHRAANNLVTPSMFLLWAFSAISIPYVFESSLLTIIALVIYLALYLLHYFLLCRISFSHDLK